MLPDRGRHVAGVSALGIFSALPWRQGVVFETEAGAGVGGTDGAGNPSPGGGGGPAPNGAGGTPGGDNGAGGLPGPYRPAGLPDHLAGENEKDTLDKLFGAYQGARAEIAKRGAPPDSADGYKPEWGDKLAVYGAGLDKDPVWGEVRKAAHELGIPADQFNRFVPRIFGIFTDAKLMDAPVDAAAERAALVPPAARNLSTAEQDAAIRQRVTDATAYVDALAQRGLSAPAVQQLKLMAGGSVGVEIAEFIRGLARDPAIANGAGGGAPGAVTREQLQQRQADPRGDPSSSRYDKSFAEETERLYRQLFSG